MIVTPTTLGALALNTNTAVKFAVLQRGTSYLKVTSVPDTNGEVNVTFYVDSTYAEVYQTKYLAATTVCWFVDLTQ
jgi:hypothetical protein